MRLFAIILAGGIGFLSLSQEIVWIRLVSITYHGMPQAFALVLGMFLFGIAVGAEIGKRICEKEVDLIKASAWMLLLSAMVDISIILYRSSWGLESWNYFAFLIIGSALCKSTLFPIMHHIGASNSRRWLGVSVSIVYFSNIIGSTLGPLVTGFILLDHLGLQQAFTLIAAADLLLAAACFAMARNWTGMSLASITVPLIIIWSWQNPVLLPALIKAEPKHIIENRHGIIHAMEGGKNGDIVLGGNVYDGRINTSLTKNSNGVNRVYILAALHPAPKHILAIGLSGGAWVKILSGFPGVERIDVVEINSGYLELIRQYPDVADILHNPKIHICIDDGRRWLRRNPNQKYDVIIMNTTYHWRNYATNLLAVEFMRTLRTHMNTGAILAFNSTGSMDSFKTAATVFSNTYLLENFIIAGDYDFRSHLGDGYDRMFEMKWNSSPIFSRDDKMDVMALHKMLNASLKTFPEIQATSSRLYEVITEQNMLTEYKYGKKL